MFNKSHDVFLSAVTYPVLHPTTAVITDDVGNNVTRFDTNVSLTSDSMTTAIEVANVIEFKVIPVLCSMGILLNAVNLLVLTEPGLKESPYVYLRALSLTDLGALLTTALFLLLTAPPSPASGFISSDGSGLGDAGVYYGAHVFFPVTSICNNASTWIVITLTIERFLFVKKPLWSRDACTPRGAKLKTGLVLLVVSLLNVPRFLSYRVLPDPDTAAHVLQIRPSAFRHSKDNKKIMWVYVLAFGVVPLIILGVTNSFLILAVKKARRQRRLLRIRNNMEAHWNREETRLTLTLISIVCLAFLCILPAAFGDLVVMADLASLGAAPSLRHFLRSPFYRVFRSVANMLLTCNMALNFVLYSAFNDKFVRVLKKMLHRWSQRLTGKKPAQRGRYGHAGGGGGWRQGGAKTPSNASKEGSSLTTKTTNLDAHPHPHPQPLHHNR